MNIKQAARAALIRLAVLAVILVAFTLFINLPWFDEELNPEVAKLMTLREVSMEGNAYPLIYVFAAAEDQDPRKAGEQFIRALQEHYRADGNANFGAATPGNTVPVWQKLLKSIACNARHELGCADLLIAEVAAAKIEDPRLRLLIKRFEQILEEPRYEAIQEGTLDMPIMPYNALMRVSRVRLAESFRDKAAPEFLLDIGKDIRLWKRVLAGGQAYSEKMVAVAGLRNDTQYLSTLIRTQRLSEDELRRMPQIMAPLTESEANIEVVFMSELRALQHNNILLTETLQGSMSPLRLATQENATFNEYYMTTTLPLRLRASLSAVEFYRQRAFEPLSHPRRFMAPPLYNLGGKQALRIVDFDRFPDFIARVHDMDGIIALVLLQAEIALNRGASVEQVVKASHYRNPYTGEPMEYDSAAGTIRFSCLGDARDVCAVRIK